MLIESILNALKSIVFTVFSWLDLPNLSDYGLDIDQAVTTITELLNMTKSVIDLLLPWNLVRVCLPIVTNSAALWICIARILPLKPLR